jgi:hypothetical protein
VRSAPDTINGTTANVQDVGITGNGAETAQLTNRERQVSRLLGADAGLTTTGNWPASSP